jgi:hypothetical protein
MQRCASITVPEAMSLELHRQALAIVHLVSDGEEVIGDVGASFGSMSNLNGGACGNI